METKKKNGSATGRCGGIELLAGGSLKNHTLNIIGHGQWL
uniref:Uncharacterized protein n=1 Tax=Candidatus Kentrum sp. DK TaxID=2126562 RepID=A0A450SSZ4_9GAMM|nr:MAG: hypothetical protein BECKDK2373C_GA0170839_10573 [Candidatus Kentron sp. DK]